MGTHTILETAEDVFLLLAAEAAGLKESHLWRIDLDRESRVINRELIADHGADTIVIHPRRVFGGSRGAVAAGAAKIILVHNHSSQDLTLTDGDHISHMAANAISDGRQCRSLPLMADHDYILTDLMAMAGDSLGISVHDHVIITDTTYFSFREGGYL